jgi:polyisoprenoid-binding protein YceI
MTTQTWNIDTSHSHARFAVRHLMISKVHGQFNKWSGKLHIDESDLSKSSVEVDIEVASVDTREEKRDAHLRSPDFFDAEKFPALRFRSKKVETEDGKVVKVIGDLTIKDVTKEVELEVEEQGRGKDPWGGSRVAYEAKTKINRKDFGLHWNVALETGGVLVAEKVEISLEIEAVLAAAEKAA